jgi:hypothetical protein
VTLCGVAGVDPESEGEEEDMERESDATEISPGERSRELVDRLPEPRKLQILKFAGAV